MTSRVVVAALVLMWAVAGEAQQSVKLQFQEGRVTLRAQNAPVRAILAEWARLGGATIVNGDRVAGPPVTLELTGVPERQALDIVLRSVAGYMLAPRRAGAAGVSAFDRILILPTSAAPRNPAPPASVAGPRPGVVPPRPGFPPRPPAAMLPDPATDPNAGDDGTDDVDAQQFNPPLTPPEPRVMPQPLVRPPLTTGVELAPDQPQPDDQTRPGSVPGGVTPTPNTNPFGIPFGSSATPGVVTPVPQQQRQSPPNRVQ